MQQIEISRFDFENNTVHFYPEESDFILFYKDAALFVEYEMKNKCCTFVTHPFITYENKDDLKLFINYKGHLSKQKTCLYFISIPKTAGTSISSKAYENDICWSFYDKNLKPCISIEDLNFWHKPIQDYWFHELYGKKLFCVVRNPYDRLLSAFYHVPGWGESFSENIKTKEEFNNQLRLFLEKKTQFLPQHDYIYYKEEKIIDFILRFETLNSDFKMLTDSHNLNINLNKNLNESTHRKNSLFGLLDINRETLDSINAKFEKDFCLLGYEMI